MTTNLHHTSATDNQTVSNQHVFADCTVNQEQTLVDTIMDNKGEYGVMVADNDVSNGFVKDGSSLPYVFEADESGSGKQNKKLKPKCAICFRNFVCVTTMKRHLVTHTGEKPFSCKVCGKQYTQKGNLRVHERTHRNDRPFECNICTQKFYRKEPMQKHQWRQHGIVHIKSRPTSTNTTNNLNVIGAEGLLYKSLNIDGTANGGVNQPTSASTKVVPSVSTVKSDMTSAPREYHLIEASSLETQHHIDGQQTNHFVDSAGYLDSPMAYIVQSTEDEVQYASIEVYTEHEVGETLNNPQNVQGTIILNTEDFADGFTMTEVDTITVHKDEVDSAVLVGNQFQDNGNNETTNSVAYTAYDSQNKPVKLKMKLAQAYLKESREMEMLQERMNEGRGDHGVTIHSQSQHQDPECNISNIRLSSTSPESNTYETNPTIYAEDQASLEAIVAKLTLPIPLEQSQLKPQQSSQEPPSYEQPKQQQQTSHEHPDTLEFLCKSCGSKNQVTDPYSFRCGTCNMKYTSIPTHLIAEPLQCIGCVQIFAHKPALKQHQRSGVKDRPFKCCKCGTDFRQKAHLQKHQWRIHRKKFEPITEASVGKEVEQSTVVLNKDIVGETVTEASAGPDLQKLISDQEASPLDLSPGKMYGTAGSITKWVQQVETARTPIIPNISIHKKPAQQSSEEMVTFKDILSRPPVNQLNDQVQLQLINPLNGGKQESLTVHLIEKKIEVNNSQLPVYAIKSRPSQISVKQPTAYSRDAEDNPLLNQIVDRASSQISILPAISKSSPRSPKRARTDELEVTSAGGNEVPTTPPQYQHQPIEAQMSTPLVVKTTPPLRLETEYSTVSSPPLNLSSNGGRGALTSPQVSPYDYRVSKSAGISGHFQRLKSLDERSGI